MQLAIRLEQLKQYGLQYDLNEPGGDYIVNCTYVKTRNPSGKLNVQEFDIKR